MKKRKGKSSTLYNCLRRAPIPLSERERGPAETHKEGSGRYLCDNRGQCKEQKCGLRDGDTVDTVICKQESDRATTAPLGSWAQKAQMRTSSVQTRVRGPGL